MQFDTPFALIGLIILIPFAVLSIAHYQRRGKSLESLHLLSHAIKVRYILSEVFFGLFIIVAIIALAGPRWGTRAVTEQRRGVDAVFAFDMSRSMETSDIAPFRLARASELAKSAVSSLGDIRIGTAMGKNRSMVALPLTWDTDALVSFCDGLLIDSVTGAGTNLEQLVNTAIGAFLDEFPARHTIILFSDGEELTGTLENAAEKARIAGIKLVCVGIGTEKGGEVPKKMRLHDDSPVEPTIISKRNSAVLKAAAERAGGIFIDGNESDAAQVLISYIRSLAPEIGVSGYRIEAAPRWNVFALVGFLFLLLSKGAEKKKRLT